MKFIHLIILCACVFSCSVDPQTSGTEIGNPRSVAVKVVGIREPAVPAKLKNGLSSGFTFDGTLSEARVVLEELRFVPGTNCAEDEDTTEISYEGPYVSDLLSNSSLPALPEISLENQTYCKIKFKIAKLEHDKLPEGIESTDTIVDHSLRFVGKTDSNVDFEITVDEEQEFELESKSGLSLDADSTALFLAFNLDQWLSQIDFGTAVQTDGKIIIHKDSNETLYEQFLLNLKRSTKLFKDKDDDGEVDEDEDDDDNEIASGDD